MEERVKRRRKIKIWSALAFAVIFAGLMFFLFSGGNMQIVLSIFREDMSTEEVREALSGFGARGYITIGILSMLQVILTFVPAEPVQVISGLTFGIVKGGLICLAGVFLGNTIIYILHRIYGTRLTEGYDDKSGVDFETARSSSKVTIIILLLYVLPAVPYGLICIFAASMGYKYHKYILLTTLGAIPSEMMGVVFGHIAIASSWIVSVCVFVVLVVLIIVLYKNKKWLMGKLNNYMINSNNPSDVTLVRKGNRLVLNIAVFVTKIFFGRKIKRSFNNKIGRLERPSIVLVNHGSALDFVYSGRLIKKERPNYVGARLYFYHRLLGKIMKSAGVIPKSMFSTDIENVKNCMKVVAMNGVLTMMPEARLSTVGRYEGIQEATFKFIKKMNVPVYVIKIEGSYFAKPKWGDKTRKGSYINVTLDKLYDKEQMSKITLEELKSGIENALYYDEFKWLETKPNIHYKSKTLAKGLENVLTTCPNCSAKYSLTTSGMTIKCEKCDFSATLDDRYSFVGGVPFKNFAEWYDWQNAKMEEEIVSNPEFKLEQKVTLKHSSKTGKSMLRVAGEGVCIFDKNGLLYRGERDGEMVEKHFPLKDVYRLLFGAGEDFEIYEGREIWYFVPEERRCCVDYYVASELVKKHFDN